MSVLGKKWFVKNRDKGKTTIQKILENRGIIEIDEISSFHDPFLFSDMEKAIFRIEQAIKDQEKIIIFGDYDVDGISGTAVLFHILKKLQAKVSYRLPNRVEDGYGLSEKFIKEFEKIDINLLITVDCGISCADIITQAKEKGIDTIITDHHTIPIELPKDAIAILHPKKDDQYPFKELTGSGVALKLAHALIEKFIPQAEKEDFLNSLVDLAALGTIADLGPLKNENRYIVKKGLEMLNKTKWIGLKKLLELSNIKAAKKVDTSFVGYRIAPRINAAGRIGDPYIALSLLLQEQEGPRVHSLGMELEKLNSHRQEMTLEALTQATQLFENQADLPYILIADHPDWHVGILGLVAGKLTEKFVRPTIILQDLGDILIASARSNEHFNIIEAITHNKQYLTTFGGHAQAAGFSVKKKDYPAFKEQMASYAKQKLKNTDLKSILEIDCEISQQEIDFPLLNEIEKLEPFGIANSKPTFLLKEIEAHFIDQVGKERNHLKFSLELATQRINVIAFNMGRHADDMRKHKKINLVCHLDRNFWNNKEYLQLQALDFQFLGQ